MRVRRQPQLNLTADERRVLEAFYCGRLSAGRLSAALAEARRRPAVEAFRPEPRVVPEPAAAPVGLAA